MPCPTLHTHLPKPIPKATSQNAFNTQRLSRGQRRGRTSINTQFAVGVTATWILQLQSSFSTLGIFTMPPSGTYPHQRPSTTNMENLVVISVTSTASALLPTKCLTPSVSCTPPTWGLVTRSMRS
eukprot:PhF_6_TR24751/c1_g3_i1/m.33931